MERVLLKMVVAPSKIGKPSRKTKNAMPHTAAGAYGGVACQKVWHDAHTRGGGQAQDLPAKYHLTSDD